MELTNRTLVVFAMVMIVAVVLIAFFVTTGGSQVSKADANRIFQERCVEYGKKNCAWDVTYEAGFDGFVQACKIVYGDEREAFTCLYSICSQCKNFEVEKLDCAEFCTRISGLKTSTQSNVTALCQDYKSLPSCAGIRCGAC